MEQKYSSVEDYFAKNKKFFGEGDSNAKRAFFQLGRYCKKVMESAEKYYAEKGENNSFQNKVTRLFTQRMTYRIYILVSNACDEMAIKCNFQLFKEEGGEHKQLMVQSDYYLQEDKKKVKMPVEDANTAFSLGLLQEIEEEEQLIQT